MTAPLPADEPGRLAALARYRILDTDPEQNFDDIAQLASFITGTPIAAVTLLDGKRQWLKAKVGLDVSETPRQDAFCAHTILRDEVMVVEDATADARFRDNPFVTGAAHIRFYAGAPLRTPDQHNLGALCVIDRKPRRLTKAEKSALEALSRLVMTELELRRSSAELATALKEVKTLSGLLPMCAYCKDIRDERGHWSGVDDYVSTHTGVDFSHGLCPKCAKIHFPEIDFKPAQPESGT